MIWKPFNRISTSAVTLSIVFMASACKVTGRGRSGLDSAVQMAALPHSKLVWPTLPQIDSWRSEALKAVTAAGGKNPTLVYINIYPAAQGKDFACPNHVQLELGLSYDSGNQEDPPRAAGFYIAPDKTKNCSMKFDLVMDAGRAIDNFLGMRPIDETGSLKDLVKVEPKKLLADMAGPIKLENTSAWNLFLKTILTPETLDSVQYQVEMLCLDRSTATAIYDARTGEPLAESPSVKDAPLCAPSR